MRYHVLAFNLRIDISPDGAIASLYDDDDVNEEMPIAEATGPTADAAVAELVKTVTFNVTDEGDI